MNKEKTIYFAPLHSDVPQGAFELIDTGHLYSKIGRAIETEHTLPPLVLVSDKELTKVVFIESIEIEYRFVALLGLMAGPSSSDSPYTGSWRLTPLHQTDVTAILNSRKIDQKGEKAKSRHLRRPSSVNKPDDTSVMDEIRGLLSDSRGKSVQVDVFNKPVERGDDDEDSDEDAA